MNAAGMTVTTVDGRTLEVTVDGPEDGLPLLFHHGTPGAAVPLGALNRPAIERGLRVVSYSRPGYGQSTPRVDVHAAPTMADDADDAAAVMDALGAREFVTLGWSGGGPRALACAARLGGRCLAAACGSGVAPAVATDLDFLAGMGPENVEELTAARAGKAALAAWLEQNGAPVFSVTAEALVSEMGGLVPDVDRQALTGELAEWLAGAFRRAGEQGIVGWLHDDLAIVRPWGFDPGGIGVPVAVWQGSEDRMVPFAHGEWLAAHVPGARPHLVEGEGHLSLMQRMDIILDDLLELAGVQRGATGTGTVT